MKKLGRKSKLSVLLIFFLLMAPTLAFGGDVPIERNFLRLPDRRWVWLEKTGWHSTRVVLGKGKRSLSNQIWSKTYETGQDEKRRHSWAYAFFVRIKPGQFITYDVNNDPQIALSTYDMGNGMIRWAILLRVKKDRLEIVDEIDGYNVAADESVFH